MDDRLDGGSSFIQRRSAAGAAAAAVVDVLLDGGSAFRPRKRCLPSSCKEMRCCDSKIDY